MSISLSHSVKYMVEKERYFVQAKRDPEASFNLIATLTIINERR